MTLTDTGPVVASINRHGPNHAVCVEATKQLPARPLVTACLGFTEAMSLVLQAAGYPAQEELWRWHRRGRLILHELTGEGIDRMVTLDAELSRPIGGSG